MKRNVAKCLKETLEKKHVCFVLITCEAPSEDGNMHVKMTYEGDAALAAYLLHGAQDFIEEKEMALGYSIKQEKIHSLLD
jgi:hypothetical protein